MWSQHTKCSVPTEGNECNKFKLIAVSVNWSTVEWMMLSFTTICFRQSHMSAHGQTITMAQAHRLNQHKRGSCTAVRCFTVLAACCQFAYQDYTPMATLSQHSKGNLPLSERAASDKVHNRKRYFLLFALFNIKNNPEQKRKTLLQLDNNKLAANGRCWVDGL